MQNNHSGLSGPPGQCICLCVAGGRLHSCPRVTHSAALERGTALLWHSCWACAHCCLSMPLSLAYTSLRTFVMVSMHLWRTSEALPSLACSRLQHRLLHTQSRQKYPTHSPASAQYAHPRGLLTAMNQPHSPRLLLPGCAHSSHPSRAVASCRW